jgi:hypothetical protein
MTYEAIVAELPRLTREERRELLEEIARSLRETRARPEEERIDLYGILKTDGPPPTDEEVREMIVDYLWHKYA